MEEGGWQAYKSQLVQSGRLHLGDVCALHRGGGGGQEGGQGDGDSPQPRQPQAQGAGGARQVRHRQPHQVQPLPSAHLWEALCPWGARGEECKERCYQDGVCYYAVCQICAAEREANGQEEKAKVYLGESSRSTTTRSEGHYVDYGQAVAKLGRRRRPRGSQDTQETGSWMVDHHQEHHGDHFPDDPLRAFHFHLLGTYRKPLTRLVAEATHIQTAKKTGKIVVGNVALKVDKDLMNRKDERFNFNPRGRQLGQEERERTQGL